MTYTILGKLVTLNEFNSANQRNRFIAAKIKKDQTELVARQLTGKRKITKPCFIKFNWLFSSKADFDNIRFGAKFCLDGMVVAGILPDDSQKWVLGFDGDTFTKVKKGDEGVIIEVEEVEEDGQYTQS